MNFSNLDWWRELRFRFLGLFRKRKLEAEMAEEIQLHLEHETAHNQRAGMSPEESRYAARRQFGGVEQVKEYCRDERSLVGLEQSVSDLGFAFRRLARYPGFSFIALVTLALGIGLNTSMFTLLNLLLLQPLPFPEKDALLRVYRTTPQSQTANHTTPDFVDLVRETTPLADLAGFRLLSLNLTQADRPPVTLNALRVSANFFSVLQVRPELGRFFNADEDHPGSQVIVLSHAAWQNQFGGDPRVVGRTIRVDGQPTTIIGVAPLMPGSLFLWGPGEAFRPLSFTDHEKTDRENAVLKILARARAGLTLEQVNLRLASLAEELARNRPREQSQDGLRAVTLQSTVHNASTKGLTWMLLGLAGFVLMIACANLANLQLARCIARGHELAIRTALGASRFRILRPLLLESLILSSVGGLLGILVATWSNDWLSSQLSANGIASFKLVLDWRVLSFALGISAFAGAAFGLAPAWLASRTRVNHALKSGTRGNTGDRAQHRLRHSLIVAQFALALVLLVGASVFIRGFDRMLSRGTGWNPHSLLQGVISLPPAKYATPQQSYAFYTQLQERLAALPGVEQVGIGWTVPIFQFLASRNYVVEGRDPPPAGREPLAFVNGVTPSFLATLQIPLVAGRNFTDADSLTSSPVVIINESAARTLFPGENPLGRRLGGTDAATRNWAEIVGIIPDQRSAISFNAPAASFQVFRPLAQESWNYVSVALRAVNAAALAESMRHAIAELDPDLPVQQLGTVEQQIKSNTSGLHLTNTILAAFASLGLFLASLGLYGVIARVVVQRTPEIGVRVALGAQSSDVAWLILRSGLRLALTGTAIGLIGSLALVRGLAGLLPDIPLGDPIPIAAVTLLLLAIALLACWLPARRAAKIDPVVALRAE